MQGAAHICSRNYIGHGQGGTLEIIGRELRVRNHMSGKTQIPYHFYNLLSFIIIIIIIIIVIIIIIIILIIIIIIIVIIIIIIIISSRHQEGVSIVLPQDPISYLHLY